MGCGGGGLGYWWMVKDWRREKAQGSKNEEGGGVIDKKMAMGSIECADTPLLSYHPT